MAHVCERGIGNWFALTAVEVKQAEFVLWLEEFASDRVMVGWLMQVDLSGLARITRRAGARVIAFMNNIDVAAGKISHRNKLRRSNDAVEQHVALIG